MSLPERKSITLNEFAIKLQHPPHIEPDSIELPRFGHLNLLAGFIILMLAAITESAVLGLFGQLVLFLNFYSYWPAYRQLWTIVHTHFSAQAQSSAAQTAPAPAPLRLQPVPEPEPAALLDPFDTAELRYQARSKQLSELHDHLTTIQQAISPYHSQEAANQQSAVRERLTKIERTRSQLEDERERRILTAAKRQLQDIDLHLNVLSESHEHMTSTPGDA